MPGCQECGNVTPVGVTICPACALRDFTPINDEVILKSDHDNTHPTSLGSNKLHHPGIITGSVNDSVIQQNININNQEKIDTRPIKKSLLKNISISILILCLVSANILLLVTKEKDVERITVVETIYENDTTTTVIIADPERPLRINSGIVGEWDFFRQTTNQNGSINHCHTYWNETGNRNYSTSTASSPGCYDPDADEWEKTWKIDIENQELLLIDYTWKGAFSGTWKYNFSIVDDVFFIHYIQSDVNGENNCTVGVRSGIVESDAEWREKVESVEQPSFCRQIFGIDIDPPDSEN